VAAPLSYKRSSPPPFIDPHALFHLLLLMLQGSVRFGKVPPNYLYTTPYLEEEGGGGIGGVPEDPLLLHSAGTRARRSSTSRTCDRVWMRCTLWRSTSRS
jgi:hypothetical protein